MTQMRLHLIVLLSTASQILAAPQVDQTTPITPTNASQIAITYLQKNQSITLSPDQISNLNLIIQDYLSKDTDSPANADRLWFVISAAYQISNLTLKTETRVKNTSSLAWEFQNKYWFTGYYGRGFIPLTFELNYRRFSQILGIDLLGNPDAALTQEIGTLILSLSALKG